MSLLMFGSRTVLTSLEMCLLSISILINLLPGPCGGGEPGAGQVRGNDRQVPPEVHHRGHARQNCQEEGTDGVYEK